MEQEPTEPRHPIRVVAQRTGLTPATLRAWERRYGVVDPFRSEGGQRLYSDRDIARLALLRRLTDAGRSISLVAELSDEDAEALLEEDRAARRATPAGQGSAGSAPEVVEAAFALTRAMDAEGLEACLRRGAVVLGAHAFLSQAMAPLLRRVGVAWSRKELGPAHEHLCTAVSERVLRWLADSSHVTPTRGRMVVATLPDERHGLGARLVAATAGLEGWQVIDLGVDLPPQDIAEATQEVGATVVALSIVNGDAVDGTLAQLQTLRNGLPEDVRVVLGGAAADRLTAAVLPRGISVVGGLDALRAFLAED